MLVKNKRIDLFLEIIYSTSLHIGNMILIIYLFNQMSHILMLKE